MPHVRMSQELLGRITKAAEETYLKANPKPDSITGLTTAITDGMLAMPAFQKTQAFLRDPDIVALAGRGGLGAHIKDLGESSNCKAIIVKGFKAKTAQPGVLKEMDFVANFTTPMTMRYVDGGYASSISVCISDIPEPHRTQITNAIQGSIDAKVQWDESFAEYQKRTSEIFSVCKSTKQLIEAWPAAEKFLPPDVIKKIFEKREETPEEAAARAKREAFTAGDLDTHILVAGMLDNTTPGT